MDKLPIKLGPSVIETRVTRVNGPRQARFSTHFSLVLYVLLM
jgi:hypothetical protein